MNDDKNRDENLLKWVAQIIKEAQDEKKYAQITVHVQDGVLIRVETKQSYVPSKG
jgi:uncharacterized protein YdhG (YjbR/CyaY superfamily)